jgi:hypothetical protein
MMRNAAAGFVLIALLLAGMPASAGPTDDVRACMTKFASLNSFRMTFDQRGQTGTMDFVQPNNWHMLGGGYEMVHLGNTSYVKMPGRGWMKTVTDSRRMTPTNFLDKVRSEARNKRFNATDLGMKNVGGESLHAYRLHYSNGESDNVVYVGNDGLPHRVDAERGQAIRFSNFNAVPAIRAPI